MKLKNVDTLFLRIFLLLLVAFSISSWLAFEVFRATAPPPPWRDTPPIRQSMHPLLASARAAAVRRPAPAGRPARASRRGCRSAWTPSSR